MALIAKNGDAVELRRCRLSSAPSKLFFDHGSLWTLRLPSWPKGESVVLVQTSSCEVLHQRTKRKNESGEHRTSFIQRILKISWSLFDPSLSSFSSFAYIGPADHTCTTFRAYLHRHIPHSTLELLYFPDLPHFTAFVG